MIAIPLGVIAFVMTVINLLTIVAVEPILVIFDKHCNDLGGKIVSLEWLLIILKSFADCADLGFDQMICFYLKSNIFA